MHQAPTGPRFAQVNLLVADMASSVAFYRLLELALPEPFEWPEGSGAFHVTSDDGDACCLALDNHPQARLWNPQVDLDRQGGNVVVGLLVDGRDDVDRLYTKVEADGHELGQPPYDAFFGSRYATVFDPDGNEVGLKSPIETARKFTPEFGGPCRSAPEQSV